MPRVLTDLANNTPKHYSSLHPEQICSVTSYCIHLCVVYLHAEHTNRHLMSYAEVLAFRSSPPEGPIKHWDTLLPAAPACPASCPTTSAPARKRSAAATAAAASASTSGAQPGRGPGEWQQLAERLVQEAEAVRRGPGPWCHAHCSALQQMAAHAYLQCGNPVAALPVCEAALRLLTAGVLATQPADAAATSSTGVL